MMGKNGVVVAMCGVFDSETSPSGSASDAVFEGIKQRIADNPSLAAKVNAMFRFCITTDGNTAKQWSMY